MQPIESRWILDRGRDEVPNIPADIPTPCRNEEVSGRRLPNGEVMDLWAGEGYGRRHMKEAYREAASLCWSICAVKYPQAFAECAAYQAKHKPANMVYGGVIPDMEEDD